MQPSSAPCTWIAGTFAGADIGLFSRKMGESIAR